MGTFPTEWAFPQQLGHFPNELGTSPTFVGSAIACLKLTNKFGCYNKLDIVVNIFIWYLITGKFCGLKQRWTVYANFGLAKMN
jgi:hypothetical protein